MHPLALQQNWNNCIGVCRSPEMHGHHFNKKCLDGIHRFGGRGGGGGGGGGGEEFIAVTFGRCLTNSHTHVQ